jgi:hypothetical protein
MHVTIIKSQPLSSLTCETGSLWTPGYDNPQIFTINVSAENQHEVGHVVGLSQTLRTSSRLATYENGGRFEQVPGAQPPCLDGDPSRIPWYNNASAGKPLPAIGQTVSFTMEDRPFLNAPTKAKSSATASHDIMSLTVAENFLLSLIDHDHNIVIKQWRWGYSYKFTPGTDRKGQTTVYATPRLVEHHETACEEQTPHLPIVTVGPVATARNDSHNVWIPKSWAPFNSQH